MIEKTSEKNYLTPNEVADLLMVSPVTVRQWASKGFLNALTTAGGHRRFLYKEIVRFAKEKGIALLPQNSSEIRVLVVDDDEQLVRFLVEALQETDQIVITEVAYDGFDAGQKMLSFQPSVILLDLMMPGLHGNEVCKHIRANPVTKTTRIVAMTGYYTQENVNRVLAAGADVCLKKPLDIQQIYREIGVSSLHALQIHE